MPYTFDTPLKSFAPKGPNAMLRSLIFSMLSRSVDPSPSGDTGGAPTPPSIAHVMRKLRGPKLPKL